MVPIAERNPDSLGRQVRCEAWLHWTSNSVPKHPTLFLMSLQLLQQALHPPPHALFLPFPTWLLHPFSQSQPRHPLPRFPRLHRVSFLYLLICFLLKTEILGNGDKCVSVVTAPRPSTGPDISTGAVCSVVRAQTLELHRLGSNLSSSIKLPFDLGQVT